MQLSFPQPPRSSAVNPLEKLMPDSHVDTISEYSPVFVNIDNTTLATGHSHSAQMKNGLKVNIVRSTATSDSNDVSIRLQVNPLDSSSDDRILTELGTRLLQEGGSLWNHSKSQIELFCTDNDITVDAFVHRNRNKHLGISDNTESRSQDIFSDSSIGAKSNKLDDGFTIDVRGPVASPTRFSDEDLTTITEFSGLESLFQLVHGIVSNFSYSDPKSLSIVSRRLFAEESEFKNGLESLCLSKIRNTLFGNKQSAGHEEEASLSMEGKSQVSLENVQEHMFRMVRFHTVDDTSV